MDRVYKVECSYIRDTMTTPWRVSVVEPYNQKTIETIRLKSDDDVYKAIDTYREQYGKKNVRILEFVYCVAPRLDLTKYIEEE